MGISYNLVLDWCSTLVFYQLCLWIWVIIMSYVLIYFPKGKFRSTFKSTWMSFCFGRMCGVLSIENSFVIGIFIREFFCDWYFYLGIWNNIEAGRWRVVHFLFYSNLRSLYLLSSLFSSLVKSRDSTFGICI